MTESGALAEGLRRLVADRLGLDLGAKDRLRLSRAMAAVRQGAISGQDALAELQRAELTDPAWQRVIRHLTIGETSFLRHREWYQEIVRGVLRPLIARRSDRRALRIWSAGCATGEEPYTVAMLLHQLLPDRTEWRIEVLGTDINAAALAAAERGVYGRRSLRELPPDLLARYFDAVPGQAFVLCPEIRSMVRFALLNLSDPAAMPTGFDLVLCRNVLIYFRPEVQQRVAAGLCRALTRDGWLAVSPAEATASWYRPLTPVNLRKAILFTADAADRRPPPVLPAPAPERPHVQPTARPCPPARQPSDPVESSPAPAPSRREVLTGARRLADDGRLAEARALCERALEDDSLDADVHLLLATICEEAGDLTSAGAAARTSVYLAPKSAAAHVRLGAVLWREGRRAQARRHLRAAVELLGPEAEDSSSDRASRRTAVAYLSEVASR